jgi:hypothetical protein
VFKHALYGALALVFLGGSELAIAAKEGGAAAVTYGCLQPVVRNKVGCPCPKLIEEAIALNKLTIPVFRAVQDDVQSFRDSDIRKHIRIENQKVVIDIFAQDDPRYKSPLYNFLLAIRRSELWGCAYAEDDNFLRDARWQTNGNDLSALHEYILGLRETPSTLCTLTAATQDECELLECFEMDYAIATGHINDVNAIQAVWKKGSIPLNASHISRLIVLLNQSLRRPVNPHVYTIVYRALSEGKRVQNVIECLCGLPLRGIIENVCNTHRLKEICTLIDLRVLDLSQPEQEVLLSSIGFIDHVRAIRPRIWSKDALNHYPEAMELIHACEKFPSLKKKFWLESMKYEYTEGILRVWQYRLHKWYNLLNNEERLYFQKSTILTQIRDATNARICHLIVLFSTAEKSDANRERMLTYFSSTPTFINPAIVAKADDAGYYVPTLCCLRSLMDDLKSAISQNFPKEQMEKVVDDIDRRISVILKLEDFLELKDAWMLLKVDYSRQFKWLWEKNKNILIKWAIDYVDESLIDERDLTPETLISALFAKHSPDGAVVPIGDSIDRVSSIIAARCPIQLDDIANLLAYVDSNVPRTEPFVRVCPIGIILDKAYARSHGEVPVPDAMPEWGAEVV